MFDIKMILVQQLYVPTDFLTHSEFTYIEFESECTRVKFECKIKGMHAILEPTSTLSELLKKYPETL